MAALEDFMAELHLMEKELSHTVLCHASLVERLEDWKRTNSLGQWYTIVGSPYVREDQIIVIKSHLLELPKGD